MNDYVGAHWMRAALQVNPYGYKGKNEPSQHYASEDDYNTALIDECDALGVQMIAITDHWCVDTAEGLIAAAEARGVVALPGLEMDPSTSKAREAEPMPSLPASSCR